MEPTAGRTAALWLAFALVACSGGEGRPPPVVQETTCPLDAGCGLPSYSGVDAAPVDAGPPCLPVFDGFVRSIPFEGTVVELDDPTLAFVLTPTNHFANTKLLSGGTVSVEVEKPGCGLAKGATDAKGAFTVDGAAAGSDIFIRLRPVDRPDLITTIHAMPSSPNGVQYPIMTRAALDRLFALMHPKLTPDPTAGQIIMNFVDISTPGVAPTGGTVASLAQGTRAYDGTNQTGPLGIGAVLNAKAPLYPGQRVSFSGTYFQTVTHDMVLAQDAVALFPGGFHSGP